MKLRAVLDIVDLMKSFLPENLYALDFSAEHYKKLLTLLKVSNNEELFNEKKGAIQKAIVDYFELTHQYIDLEIAYRQCSIKKRFRDNADSENLDRMLHENALKLLDIQERREEFLPLPFLLSIPSDVREKIMGGFADHKQSIENARTLTRQQIQEIFSLGERDITFFLRGKISVRFYVSPKKLPEGVDRRFNGASPEEMEKLYKHYFPEGMWNDIEEGLDEVLEEKLNFTRIDNVTFKRSYIPVFRSMVEILLLDKIEVKDREHIEGLTGYILRQHFDQILLYTANNLLQYVEERDKNAQEFIRYFTDDIVIDEKGNKIQKYAIVDPKEQRWNFSSLISILMQHKQAKLRIATQKEAISAAQERVTEVLEEIKVEKKNKQHQDELLAQIEGKIAANDILDMKSKRYTDNDRESQVKRHKELLNAKKNETKNLELITNRIANKTIELTRRRKKHEHESSVMQTIMEQLASLRETYQGIVQGLALVLAKR